MAIINMTKTCKTNGIHEFSRTRGGWMKFVEGIDKSQKGAYSFIGDNFTKVGNFKSNLRNGLYLDQSTSVDDGDKVLTMNLFAIQDGDVTLLKSVPKASGWEIDLWDKADDYFHSSEEVTAQDIVNTIKEMTDNQDIIAEVVEKLSSEKSESHYDFRNWFEVRTILSDINCLPLPVEPVKNLYEKSKEDTYVFKCDALYSPQKKYLTTFFNLMNKANINEETFVDCKDITTTTFRSKHFQNEIKNHKYTTYFAHTIPNATGFRNGIKVVIAYFEDNTIVIRHFRYFFNTSKIDQYPVEFDEDLLLH